MKKSWILTAVSLMLLHQVALADSCVWSFTKLVARVGAIPATAIVLPLSRGPETKHWTFYRRQGVPRKVIGFGLDLIGKPLVRGLLPGLGEYLIRIPIPWYGTLERPVDHIFRKQFKNRHYVPCEKEKQALVDWGAWEKFNKKHDYMEKYPIQQWVRKWLGRIIHASLLAAYPLVANQAVQLTSGGMISTGDFTDDEDDKWAPEEDEIQLLVETAPFPHIAIRIKGGKVVDNVYSYGYTHVHSYDTMTYVEAKEIFPLLGEMPEEQLAKLIGKKAARKVQEHKEKIKEEAETKEGYDKFFTETGEWLYQKSGWENEPRSIQVVTLRIGKEQKEELRRYLEDQVLKRYENVKFINNCSTMTCRALNQEEHKSTEPEFGSGNENPALRKTLDLIADALGEKNAVIQASPSGVLEFLTLKKTLGSQKVTRAFMVTQPGSDKSAKIAGRNALINLYDTQFNTLMIIPHMIRRSIFDGSHELDDMQYYEPEVKEIVEVGFEKQARQILENDAWYQAVGEQIEMIKQLAPEDPIRKARVQFVKDILLEGDLYEGRITQAREMANSKTGKKRDYEVGGHLTQMLEKAHRDFSAQLEQ